MINEAMIEEYTENIDTSEMIIEYYNRRKTQDLENYFIQIEEWLNRDVSAYDNKPLIIDTDVGVEKKTLLVKWMAYHQESTQKVLTPYVIRIETKQFHRDSLISSFPILQVLVEKAQIIFMPCIKSSLVSENTSIFLKKLNLSKRKS